MTLFRRHIRFVATAWLLFQATSLSALVPRACCLAHDAAVAASVTCHEQPVVPRCHEPASDAAMCPMHAAHGHDHSGRQTEKPRAHECAIRGTCGGPAAAMLTLLSTQGVLTAPATMRIDVPPAGEPIVSPNHLLAQFQSPDAPPPRA
jgi:hypothetical protein